MTRICTCFDMDRHDICAYQNTTRLLRFICKLPHNKVVKYTMRWWKNEVWVSFIVKLSLIKYKSGHSKQMHEIWIYCQQRQTCVFVLWKSINMNLTLLWLLLYSNKDLFYNKRQPPRPRSFIIFSCSASGYFPYSTTLTCITFERGRPGISHVANLHAIISNLVSEQDCTY